LILLTVRTGSSNGWLHSRLSPRFSAARWRPTR
jgi:hypothetical protein